jgi:hypothetical protein
MNRQRMDLRTLEVLGGSTHLAVEALEIYSQTFLVGSSSNKPKLTIKALI